MLWAVFMGGVVSKAFPTQTPIKFMPEAAFLYPHIIVSRMQSSGLHNEEILCIKDNFIKLI
jgi:hypothetical protein